MANSAGAERSLAVGLLGHGAIGSVVAEQLRTGAVPGAHFAGFLNRSADRSADGAVAGIDELIARCDVVVEAAGPGALESYAAQVLAAGRILLALSVGAFLREGFARHVTALDGPGRLVLCNGAIAGLDLVRTARLADPHTSVRLCSTKHPEALIQPWMGSDERDRLLSTAEPTRVFQGAAPEAVRLFPANLNVAAALVLAVGSIDAVDVELLSDPRATATTHTIIVRSSLGEHRFVLANTPSATNGATSAIVPWSVLRSLRDLVDADPLSFARTSTRSPS